MTSARIMVQEHRYGIPWYMLRHTVHVPCDPRQWPTQLNAQPRHGIVVVGVAFGQQASFFKSLPAIGLLLHYVQNEKVNENICGGACREAAVQLPQSQREALERILRGSKRATRIAHRSTRPIDQLLSSLPIISFLFNFFQDSLVSENICSFGAELAAKRQVSCHNRSAKRLRKYWGAAKERRQA